MLPPDNHVHTEWSYDTPSTSTMELTCREAVRVGLPAVAFTEHLDFSIPSEGDPVIGRGLDTGGYRGIVMDFDVQGYLAEVERCRGLFPELRILSGVEAGEAHLFGASIEAILAQGRFDRVLGSLHGIVLDGRLVDVDQQYRHLDAAEVMRRYFGEVVELVEGSDLFQVLAHCDFPRRYWPRGAGEFHEKDFEEEYRQVFRTLAPTGRALEINTRTPLWSADVMRWWYEAGGEAVSFGSDAHVPTRVGDRFDVAVDVVEAAGFRPGRDRFDFWRR